MITPDTTKIAQLKEEVDHFLYDMQEVKIASQEDYTKAGDTLKIVMNRIKALEDKRKEYTGPLDDLKKTIMADFKGISEPLEEFVTTVKGKMLEWHQAEQKRKDEEQKRLEAEALERAKKENVSEVNVPVVNQEIRTQRGEHSTQTVKKVWKWEAVDIASVPKEYLTIDGPKVTQAVRDGNRSIPGIRIYQEDQITIR